MSKNPVVHFEMPAKDLKRASDFYSKAFGWNMNQLGPEMGNYLLAGTADTDDNQMIQNPGEINGGFFKYEDKAGWNAPHVVIQVQDLNQTMEDIKNAGGTIEGEPMDIPGIGTYIAFTDPEGNNVGALQPPK